MSHNCIIGFERGRCRKSLIVLKTSVTPFFAAKAATATMQLTEFYLATSYKMYSVSSQTKYGNFS